MTEVTSTSNIKLSNIEVTNITKLKDFTFNIYENIVYINNIINTNNNNLLLNLNDTNTTFVIQNNIEPLYKKSIQEILLNTKNEFISNNHFLKVNDLITLENIKYNGLNLLNDNLQIDNVIFKVIETTRNKFVLMSSNNYNTTLNNITNIIKTTSILTDAYFNIYSNKTQKKITKVEITNKFFCQNHGLILNDIVKLENIKNDTVELLEPFYQNNTYLYIVTLVGIDYFELTHYIVNTISTNNNSTTIIKFTDFVTDGYFKLIKTSSLNSELNIILPNNTTDNYGVNYNIIINTPIKKFSIKTTNEDKIIGVCNIGSDELLGSEIIESSDNTTKFSVTDLDLLYSKMEIINIKKNTWYLNCNLYSNKINYIVKYKEGEVYLNEIKLARLDFYVNFTYGFDISDSNLLNNCFYIVDKNYNSYYKNILNHGLIGKPNAKLILYIGKNDIVNTEYYIKYKKNVSDSAFTYKLFYIVKEKPNYFTN